MQQATATQSHQKQISNFHDKYSNAVLASEAAFCVAVRAYTAMQNWNRMDLVPCWQCHPKGMERSVIIPAGIILNGFKTNSQLMPSKSTVHPFKYGMTEKIKHIRNVKKNKLKQQFLKSAKFTS